MTGLVAVGSDQTVVFVEAERRRGDPSTVGNLADGPPLDFNHA